MTKDEAIENIRYKVRFSGDDCNFDCAYVSETEKRCLLTDESTFINLEFYVRTETCKALFKED